VTEDEKLELLKTAAKFTDSDCGEWAYQSWAKFNQEFFDNKLKVGGINWGLTPHGSSLGFYDRSRNLIVLHSSLISPKGDAWGKGELMGERFAADTLLHEMIHQYNWQILQYQGKESHNCKVWCNQINRIAPALGLKPNAAVVKQKREREPGQTKGNGKVVWVPDPGMMSRMDLASWPHSARTHDYYRGN